MIKLSSGSALAAGLLLAAAHHGALVYVVAGTGAGSAVCVVRVLSLPPGYTGPLWGRRRPRAARVELPGPTGWHVVSVTVHQRHAALPARPALPAGQGVE